MNLIKPSYEMNYAKNLICLLLLSGFAISVLHAQAAIPAAGGNASGSGGSVSYTVGQVLYNSILGINGTVAQGVQQPFEISVITAVKNTEEIILECVVYPNPTRGYVKLVIGTRNFENLRFQIYNFYGLRILDKKIDNKETDILMENLSPSTYYLKVLNGSKEIKTFKIVKN
jgi:hypothetical protein